MEEEYIGEGMEEVYKELIARRDGGGRHRNLIEYIQRTKHNGCDRSEDDTMIMVYYKEGGIMIAPYHIIHKFIEK